ncbi:MAG: ComF family protein [Methylicorpusculum sp.]|uniref:ComF family protein n=1 Tax=Methylicorpusculum sp. TaxID=2713644 RepID=UPI00271AD664|nr:ComF family protein [Methylicorpusculum sp.]MDO8938275.1 ComF family protein [Methylicorpusculum sp.]MDO9239460.1 ComF family protein [Methylicorpusculum sp.]MDP2202125.1 ComF family protein [Methylicorpusculum sp.]
MVNNWSNIIQNYLFPPTCILCGHPGQREKDLCLHCESGLIRATECCYRCGALFEQSSTTPMLCGACLNKTPYFDETHAVFVYTGAIRYLLTSLKFGGQLKNARLIGQLMAEQFLTIAEIPECLIPVPLHSERYRERGFNQAIEITKTIARLMDIPVDLDSSIRQRNTEHQTELSAKQRKKNMLNAFAVNKKPPFNHVAIVDDVMTTGTTVSELAKALKNAGVHRVDVWVCARA